MTRYTGICNQLGIYPVPINSLPSKEAQGWWVEERSFELTSYLLVQALIGCYTQLGITPTGASKDFERTKSRSGRERVIEFIPETIQYLVKSDVRPSLVGLAGLGLLRLMPGNNFTQAERRFGILQAISKDPVSINIYSRNPRIFSYQAPQGIDPRDDKDGIISRELQRKWANLFETTVGTIK